MRFITLKSFLTVAFIITLPTLSLAVDPCDGVFGGPCGGTEVPLDGGLSFLAAAGIGYAAKKVISNRKKDTPTT